MEQVGREQHMQTPTHQELSRLAESAAFKAGQRVKELQSGTRTVNSKGFRDFVTDADFLSQAIITNIIREQYPTHGFLTEEADESLPKSGPIIWVIDPVDGTTNYSRNHPNYSISIAAAANKLSPGTVINKEGLKQLHPAAGVIYDPVHSEMFAGAAGFSAALNNKPIQVSNINKLSDAVIGLDWGRSYDQRERMIELLGRLAHQVHTIRAVGSAAQALAWVACGRLDVYINLSIGPWDCAAGTVIINEAGGRVSNLSGRSWQISDPGCVASNGSLQASILETVLDLS
jgi:myo-inositol-1(or 4)-monophosphatase